MAAGILHSPGTVYGPCLGACKHRDCELTRAMARLVCPHCEKPIGFEKRFYSPALPGALLPGAVSVHEVCWEKSAREAEGHQPPVEARD